MANQLAGASQIVVAVGDLTTPNANTATVVSGAIAVSIYSGAVALSATLSSSNVNVVQIAGTVVSGQGNGTDAVTTTAGTMPVTAYLMGWNSTAGGWDRIITNRNAQNNIGPGGVLTVGVAGWAGTNYTLADIFQGSNDGITANKQGLVTQSYPYVLDTAGNWDRVRAALGTTGIPSVNTEGTRTTYSAGVAQAAFSAASGTDVFLINGSATAVVRVLRAGVSFTSLQPVNIPMVWTRRSAVTTAGTSALPTIVKHDTSNAAASSVVVNYTNTAGQAPGTPLGAVRSAVVAATLASVGSDTPWVVDFSTRNGQAMTLRGTSDVLALTISSGGATTGASNISVDIELSESLA